MKIAIGQTNPTVGDLTGNVDRMVEFAIEAAGANAGLIVFPELSITGYPPRDLVEKPSFIRRSEEALRTLARKTAHLSIGIVCGYVGESENQTGKHAANRAALLQSGGVLFQQTKRLLPTYDVFDEVRYFVPGVKHDIFRFAGYKAALAICEDAWNDKQFWSRRLYTAIPSKRWLQTGADLLLSINASPYSHGQARAPPRHVYCRRAPLRIARRLWSTRWAATISWSSTAPVSP